MTASPATTEPPAPTAGLLASLNTHTFLEETPARELFAVLVFTYRTPQFADVDDAEVEREMLGVAAAAGAGPVEDLPKPGGSVVRRDGADAVVHLAHCSTALRVENSRLARVLSSVSAVLIVIGLDALPTTTTRADLNEYLYAGQANGRLRTTIAPIDDGRPRAMTAVSEAAR